jgi:hypothetical protein
VILDLGAKLALAIPAHFLGDYLLQTNWMAGEKTKRWSPAILHGITYTLPFLFITQNPLSLLIIAGTHAVIDRYRLARLLVWLKNQATPKRYRPSKADAFTTGDLPSMPAWLATWVMIWADNGTHMAINAAALIFIG